MSGRARGEREPQIADLQPTDATFVVGVKVKNFKSIGGCDVRLAPLTFLTGPNGSGKSNFLDALRFAADSLRTSLDHALRDRGGIAEVRRRSGGHPTHFGIRLDFRLRDGASGHYAFLVGARQHGGHEVQREECLIRRPGLLGADEFVVENGELRSAPLGPAPSPDRLYLGNVSGLPQFRPIYDALSNMGFYNLNPDSIRDLQSPAPGRLLSRDGSNLASVLDQLAKLNPEIKKRIEEYLAAVVPGVQGVDAKAIGPKETLLFRQLVAGSNDPWRFLAANMSDGTLRALGVLVALFQSARPAAAPPVSLVGIEEPELALHPAAAAVLLDGLREASEHTQVLVTSHSPDLLDNPSIEANSILAVYSESGNTQIAPLDDKTRDVLRRRLYTAGELLRMDQMRPDPEKVDLSSRQMDLFDTR